MAVEPTSCLSCQTRTTTPAQGCVGGPELCKHRSDGRRSDECSGSSSGAAARRLDLAATEGNSRRGCSGPASFPSRRPRTATAPSRCVGGATTRCSDGRQFDARTTRQRCCRAHQKTTKRYHRGSEQQVNVDAKRTEQCCCREHCDQRRRHCCSCNSNSQHVASSSNQCTCTAGCFISRDQQPTVSSSSCWFCNSRRLFVR